jgi:SNF2 family DNA or RNA helicase
VNFDAVIVDEGHFLNSYQSQQSKAVYRIGKKADKRIVLTGTPVRNKGEEIYGLLHFLYPQKFPSFWQFTERYFNLWEAPWGVKETRGYKRQEELQEILDITSVQRKRSDVMKFIPPKQYQTIEVEMSAKQKKVYDDMFNTFIVQQDGETLADASSVLAQLTRLRQIALDPDLLNIKAPSAKESFLLEWLEDNPNEQVIIFSNFSSYLKKLQQKLLTNARMIIGETPKEKRQEYVQRFQDGKLKIILANIEAAGVGLTLDAASVVIFLDRHYAPPMNQQAEDRIVPTTENSNQNCTIIDVVCKNSIDEHINDLLSKKKNIIEVINNYKNIKDLIHHEQLQP